MSNHDHQGSWVRLSSRPGRHVFPSLLDIPGGGAFVPVEVALCEPHTGISRDREHRHDVYHLVIFTRGRNEFMLGGRREVSLPGLCVLTHPADPHNFLPRRRGVTEYHAVTFTFKGATAFPSWGAVLNHYTGMELEDAPALFTIPEEEMLAVQAAVATLRHALMTPAGTFPQAPLYLGILQLLAVVARLLRDQRTPSAAPVAPEIHARDYLDLNYALAGTLAGMARDMGVSAAHLGRAFVRRFGISPVRYRTALRMEAARELLLHGDLLIKEIAYQLGYPDPFTFSKAFRRHYGCAPEAVARLEGTAGRMGHTPGSIRTWARQA